MRTKTCALAVGAVAALVLSGCSAGDDGGGGGESEGGTTAVTVGVLPIVPSAALQLGIDEGIFEEHGFDVTLESGQGGAALLPAVVSQQMEFAISNPLSVMLAQEQGLDVQLVTGYSHSKAEGDDVTSVWAAPDSGIERPADLAGKTVAVNTLKTMGEVSIREIVTQDGGDGASVEFVEMGFPDMPAALDGGDVDAVWVPEPFQTQLKEGGNTLVSYNYQDVFPGVMTMGVITSGALAEKDPEMVEEFTAAVDEVTAYAQENPDAVATSLAGFLEMPEDVAGALVMEDFRSDVDADAMQTLSDLSVEDGILPEPVDMGTFLPSGG
ncbi:MAG: ABC transporter substrate-binding protein [Actinomycetes bacterium]